MVITVTQKHINDARAYKGTIITRNCPIARALKDRGFDPEVNDDYCVPYMFMKVPGELKNKFFDLPDNAQAFIELFDADDTDPSELKPFKFTIKGLKPIDTPIKVAKKKTTLKKQKAA